MLPGHPPVVLRYDHDLWLPKDQGPQWDRWRLRLICSVVRLHFTIGSSVIFRKNKNKWSYELPQGAPTMKISDTYDGGAGATFSGWKIFSPLQNLLVHYRVCKLGSETYYFNRLIKFLGFPQILAKYKPCSEHCTFGRWRARDNNPEWKKFEHRCRKFSQWGPPVEVTNCLPAPNLLGFSISLEWF